jgi:peroxiredoxin Q/BCP
MAQLRQDYRNFEKVGTVILVVGPENGEAFARYWKENGLPFIGLPDPEHKVLKLYGQEVNLFKLGRMPAQALIDRNGLVRFIHYGHEMSDIPDTAEMIELAETLNRE